MRKDQILSFYKSGMFSYTKAIKYLMLIGMTYQAAWFYLERTYN